MGAMDLLVQVRAASVNPVDAKTREGKLKTLLKYRFPLVLGNDLSGVVSDVGDQVTRFKKGDAVYARLDVDRMRDALAYSESGRATGKVVIKVA